MLERPLTGLPITVETEVSPETATSYYQLYLTRSATWRPGRWPGSCSTSTSSWRRCTTLGCTSTSPGTGRGDRDVHAHLRPRDGPLDQPGLLRPPLPRAHGAGAVYYLGFTLVHRQRRQTRIFRAMTERIVELLVDERAVCAWDICGYNDDVLGSTTTSSGCCTATPR